MLYHRFLLRLHALMFSLCAAGVDYQPLTSRQLTFRTGLQTHMHCIEVMVIGDDVVEGEENFTIVIVSASPMPGVIIGTPNVTQVIIEDDDGM